MGAEEKLNKYMSFERKNFLFSNNVTLQPFSFTQKNLNYPYKCTRCGTPHKHRNKNKYPDLCKSCAAGQAVRDRWKRYRENKQK